MKDLYFRENYLQKIRGFYHDVEMIKVITGVRRCGKSSLMQMVSQELMDSGIAAENIIVLNLDQRPYRRIHDADQLEDMIVSKTEGISGTKYLFIDEVQNVKDYEMVVNAFREEGDFSIFITGSNSYLLSGELMTKLTGRYIEFPLRTLSFDEYIGMKKFLGKSVGSNDEEFVEYIRNGGFPLSLKYETFDQRRTYTSNIITEIFKKDIRTNYRIRRKDIFDKIQNFIISNFGSTVSVDALCEYITNTYSSVTKTTVYQYLEILENAKIIQKCQRFDLKSKRVLKGGEKYYLSDLGFYFALRTDNRINYGPVLENIVYNYCAAKGYEISVGKIGSLEIDFILRNNEQDYAYVQVARTIDNDRYDEHGLNITEEREYRPLEKIKDGYPKILLTMDRLLQKRNGIQHYNLVDLMADNMDLF